MSDMPKYYWYQAGGYVMAVDAHNQRDAKAAAMIAGGPNVEYLGRFYASAFPKTACGVTSPDRQEEISARVRGDQ